MPTFSQRKIPELGVKKNDAKKCRKIYTVNFMAKKTPKNMVSCRFSLPGRGRTHWHIACMAQSPWPFLATPGDGGDILLGLVRIQT